MALPRLRRSVPRVGTAVLGLVLAAIWSGPSQVQTRPDEATLADIRQELNFLLGEILYLKAQLSTTGPPRSGSAQSSGTVSLRVDAIESEVRQLTGAVEELQFRVEAIVEDGTRRIGDLDFRLVELEGGDLSSVGKVPPLGEADPEPDAVSQPEPGVADTEATQGDVDEAAIVASPIVDETTDEESRTDAAAPQQPVVVDGDPYELAMVSFESGNHEDAIRYLDAHIETGMDAEAFADARFWQGESHFALEQWQAAASAYLDSFTNSANGPRAPAAILGLGISLGELGHGEEACLMLSEAAVRGAGNPGVVDRVEQEQVRFGCI